MFILFNQMFCSRTNVQSKARGCCDPPGPHGSPQAVVSREFPRPFASESGELHHRQFFFGGHQTVTGFVCDMIFCIAVHVVRIPCVPGQSRNGSDELPAVELHPSCFSNFRSFRMRQRPSTPAMLFPGLETGDVKRTFFDIKRFNL